MDIKAVIKILRENIWYYIVGIPEYENAIRCAIEILEKEKIKNE